MRFVPFYAHNTGRKAVTCSECHGDPAFLGFGQNVLEEGSVKSTLLCPRNPKKALDGFLSMDEGRVVSHAAIARDGARPLSARGGPRRSRRQPLPRLPPEAGRPDLPEEAGP